QKTIKLIFKGVEYLVTPMSNVQAADAPGKVDVPISIDIFKPCVLGLSHVNRRAMRKPTRHSFCAPFGQRLRFGARNFSAKLNRGHRGLASVVSIDVRR